MHGWLKLLVLLLIICTSPLQSQKGDLKKRVREVGQAAESELRRAITNAKAEVASLQSQLADHTRVEDGLRAEIQVMVSVVAGLSRDAW